MLRESHREESERLLEVFGDVLSAVRQAAVPEAPANPDGQGDEPGAAEVVLEAGDILTLIAARRLGAENERGEGAVVGGLDADVAAVHGVEADPEDDVAVVGGGEEGGEAAGGMADNRDAIGFALGGA